MVCDTDKVNTIMVMVASGKIRARRWFYLILN